MPKNFPYQVTKTFGHDLGWSACFRQWRAKSHCRFLHGYAIAVRLVVGSVELNDTNWCFDFGDFKEIKHYLEGVFDHRLLVAEDDPLKDELCGLGGLDGAAPLVLPNVGCEAFAQLVFEHIQPIIGMKTNDRAKLLSVCIMEHGANSATYSPNE